LESHGNSKHTRRKYDAQLQQLCEWAILKEIDLISVTTNQIEEYLGDLARGQTTPSVRNPGVVRSQSTLLIARSVLCSLFEHLVEAGLRIDNPARRSALPKIDSPAADLNITAQVPGMLRWLDVRQAVIDHAKARSDDRDPLLRAIAVAELASWSGLRRSELAAGTMGDFVSLDNRWWIKVRRFGSGQRDLIEVPQPAMDAVLAYRSSRGLSPLPEDSEHQMPLISRVRSEQAVNAWTVANSLNCLLVEGVVPADAKAPAIVVLRRAVATEALKADIATHQLARHLRSRKLVDQVAAQLEAVPLSDALRRLAA